MITPFSACRGKMANSPTWGRVEAFVSRIVNDELISVVRWRVMTARRPSAIGVSTNVLREIQGLLVDLLGSPVPKEGGGTTVPVSSTAPSPDQPSDSVQAVPPVVSSRWSISPQPCDKSGSPGHAKTFVSRNVESTKPVKLQEALRDRAGEAVAGEVQPLQVGELAEFGRDGTLQFVIPELHATSGWRGCRVRAGSGRRARCGAGSDGPPARKRRCPPQAAITRACYHDPDVMRAYEECAEGYGFLVSPCPVRDPKKKGRVEAGVKYVYGVDRVSFLYTGGDVPGSLPGKAGGLPVICYLVKARLMIQPPCLLDSSNRSLTTDDGNRYVFPDGCVRWKAAC